MADRLTQAQRSWNMARIKGKGTKPELLLRKLLFSLGFRYRVNYPVLPGKPDIVFPMKKKIIFLHGCYWHRHQGCRFAYLPKTRVDFWKNKFSKTVSRDEKTLRILENSGWKILVIWECETRDKEAILGKVVSFLKTEN